MHSQLRFPWKGNTVLVNTWHTGKVHLQGYGASELARHLSGMSSSFSRVRPRSFSPGSTGDSSGGCNNHFWVSRNFCLTLFMWIFHLWTYLGLGSFGGHRLFRSFFPRRMSRRKKIRGSGSQTASRRGARPRFAALALKARARQHSAILSTVLDFSSAYIPSAPWLLVLSRSKLVPSFLFLFLLLFFVFGLQGHGGSPAAVGSLLVSKSDLGVSSLINQEGFFARIAQVVVLTPICQTVAHFVSLDISISARFLACVAALVFVPAFVMRPRSHASHVVSAPGACIPARSLVVPASGICHDPACLSHPSCDSCNLGKLFLFRRIGTVTVLAFLACSVTPVLWQTGLDGVRVGEASHPGPTHPTPEGAPTTLNVSEVLTHVSGSASSFPAADPGDPVPGSSPTQAPHP